MFKKNIRHPSFLYVVFVFLLFAVCSSFVSAQSYVSSNVFSCSYRADLGQSCTPTVYPSPNTVLAWNDSAFDARNDGENIYRFSVRGYCYATYQGANYVSYSTILTSSGSYSLTSFTCHYQPACEPPNSINPVTGQCGYCPSGVYDSAGECMNEPICVYPNVNVGGDCVCDAGYNTQGYLNGQPICQQQCPEGTFPGAVNGVSGCYGAGEQPDCPQGSYYGAVNGVWGCWGGDGSGGSNSSGGANSSSGGGSGSSSGNGGGGDGGEGGGGYEGVPYDPSEPCPSGYEKTANNTCEGQGDCFPGYTSVVISQSPFYAMCMPDEPSQSSSSSSQSSSSSSQQSSGSGTGSSSGGGSGSSSGSGGGGTGEEPGAGECDPTSSNYMDCITPSGDMPSHTVTESGATTFAQVNQNFFNSLSQTAPIVAISNMTGFIELESPVCPAFSIDLSDTIIGRTIATDLHCILWEDIAGVLSVCMIGVWLWLGFRVFASA